MNTAAARSPSAGVLCEMLLRHSPGCSWLLNPGGEFQAVHGAAERVFARPARELAGLPFTDFFASDARPGWVRRLERVFAGRTVHASAGTFSITLFPVRLPRGEIGFAGGTARENVARDAVLHAVDALETDRARFFEMLHDHVGPHLSAAGMQLDLLRMDLAEQGIPMEARIAEIQTTLDQVMAFVRSFHREEDAAIAERVGLRGALDGLAGRLRADFKGNVRVMAHGVAQPEPRAATAFYRIADAAARHATGRKGCSAIEILVKSVRYGTELEIKDNGDGEEGTEGVMLMEHYAGPAGIELEIESGAGQETVVRALLRRAEEPVETG